MAGMSINPITLSLDIVAGRHAHGASQAPLANREADISPSVPPRPLSSPPPLTPSAGTPEGIECYGDERKYLAELAKFYNSPVLSDVVLRIGGTSFDAHKLILVRASDVFERMLSREWNSENKKEIELFEDAMCVDVFPRFLHFLYSCHVSLTLDNTLPILILADKYNVLNLRCVCINFACTRIIPKLQLKDVFHVWFQYATKGYHQKLVAMCVKSLSTRMDDIMLSAEWHPEWLSLDKEQMIEFLRSSDLTIKDEYELWNEVITWITHQIHPNDLEETLPKILEHIRFPMMTSDQIALLECSSLTIRFPEIFQPHMLLAYKYHALPLMSRAGVREFYTSDFMLRNYTDLRWDKRLGIVGFSSIPRCSEVSLKFSTRASTFPAQTWEWELKVHPKGFSSTCEDFRVTLCSNLILDQPRPVEYWLSIVGRDSVIGRDLILHTVSGKKNFSKTRYTMDTEMDKKVSVSDFHDPNTQLLVDDCLIFQIIIKPVE